MTGAVQNSEIIDAMQDAVLNVVNASVSTAQELASHHNEPFYLSAEFWVAMSFVLTVVVLFKPVGKMVVKGFKKRI